MQGESFALASGSSLSIPESVTGQSTPVGPSGSHRPTLGNVARLVTTLARQVSLPVHTRLSFNDSGRITHHQDIWDVKDVVNLVPGFGVAQWIGSRLMARSLSTAFGMYEWASNKTGSSSGSDSGSTKREGEETPRGTAAGPLVSVDPSVSPTFSGRSSLGVSANALGLHLSERLAQSRGRAPDTDNDS